MDPSPSFSKAAGARMIDRRSWIGLLLAIAMVWTLARADEEVPRGTPYATSQSGRVVVYGLSSEESLAWAVWSEEVLERMTQWMGAAPPFSQDGILRVHLEEHPAHLHGEVLVSQKIVGGYLAQEMVLSNPDALDPEDALEALSRLLLNRYLVEVRPQGSTQLLQASPWLGAGVAQNLYPELKTRNSRVMVSMWREGQRPTWEDLLQVGRDRPPLREERAACGMAVQWLYAVGRGPEWIREAVRREAAGQRVTPEWLVARQPELSSVRDMEIAFDLWMAEQTRVRHPDGVVAPHGIEDLERALVIEGDRLGAFFRGVLPERLSLEDLVAMRYEPWMPQLAAMMEWRVRALGIGQAPGYRQVTEQFGDFFSALAVAHRVKPRWWSREHLRVEQELWIRLAEARAGLRRLTLEALTNLDAF